MVFFTLIWAYHWPPPQNRFFNFKWPMALYVFQTTSSISEQGTNTLDIFLQIIGTGMVPTILLMVTFSLVHGSRVNNMVPVFKRTKMEISLTDPGRMEDDMEFSSSRFPMEQDIKHFTTMELDKDNGIKLNLFHIILSFLTDLRWAA